MPPPAVRPARTKAMVERDWEKVEGYPRLVLATWILWFGRELRRGLVWMRDWGWYTIV